MPDLPKLRVLSPTAGENPFCTALENVSRWVRGVDVADERLRQEPGRVGFGILKTGQARHECEQECGSGHRVSASRVA